MSLMMAVLAVSLVTVPGRNPLQREALPRTSQIDLFWSDYELLRRKLPSGGRKAVEREVEAIFVEAGISVRFQEGSPEDNGARGPFAIGIILMPHGAHALGLSPAAMGANVIESQTVYVFFPVILQILGEDMETKVLHDARKGRVFARALARVLAHEFVHAIDPKIPHGPEGSLMSENLTRKLLLSHELSLHESTIMWIQKSLSGSAAIGGKR
jgi:hypothetical protein